MVDGLFRRREHEVVMSLLGRSVVFVSIFHNCKRRAAGLPETRTRE